VLTRAKERQSFGGTLRFVERRRRDRVLALLAPIMWFGHTLFLARLPFTRGRLERARCATTTRCRSASPAGRCGRIRWSASASSSCWR
jgi:hypothetical protein